MTKKKELLSLANAKCYTVHKTKRNAYKIVALKGRDDCALLSVTSTKLKI